MGDILQGFVWVIPVQLWFAGFWFLVFGCQSGYSSFFQHNQKLKTRNQKLDILRYFIETDSFFV